MRKGGELFLDNFARLGLFGKVLALAGPPEEESSELGNDKVETFPCVLNIFIYDVFAHVNFIKERGGHHLFRKCNKQ